MAYHNSRRVTRREFLLTRAGVLPVADAVCAAAALFPAPHPVDPRHGNKLPRTSFTFTAQPRYSVLATLRPYDSCRVYHNSRRTPRREFLLTRAGVLPFADTVCAATNAVFRSDRGLHIFKLKRHTCQFVFAHKFFGIVKTLRTTIEHNINPNNSVIKSFFAVCRPNITIVLYACRTCIIPVQIAFDPY